MRQLKKILILAAHGGNNRQRAAAPPLEHKKHQHVSHTVNALSTNETGQMSSSLSNYWQLRSEKVEPARSAGEESQKWSLLVLPGWKWGKH